MASPFAIPPETEAGLQRGFASAGMGFRTLRPLNHRTDEGPQASPFVEEPVALGGVADSSDQATLPIADLSVPSNAEKPPS